MSVRWDRSGEGWGTVRLGSYALAARTLLTLAGIALWLGTMLVLAGGEALVALWTNLVFVGGLILIGSLTRTVSLHALAWLFLAGGFLMGVTIGLVMVYNAVDPGQGGRGVVVPILEELLKLAPVAYVLWLWRRTVVWSLGATDVLLMAAAAGAGFSVLEDAMIRSRFGWPDQLPWLPVTEIVGGRMIAGHGIWTALAGASLGVALLLRHRGPLVLPLAVAGLAWATLDHISNNTGELGGLVMDGWLTIVLFVVAVVAAIGFDLLVRSRHAPVAIAGPAFGASLAQAGAAWRFDVVRRALAYAEYRRRMAVPPHRARAALVALSLLNLLVDAGGRAAGEPKPAVT